MPNLLGMPRIAEVHGFAEIPPSHSALFDLRGPLNWGQAPDLIVAADRDLDLDGDLVQFYQTCEISFQKIEPLTEATRESFFSNKCESEPWQAYSQADQSGIRYWIVVEYCDHSETILGDDDMKAQVMQYLKQEVARDLAHSVLAGKQSSDYMESLMKIGNKIMYNFGIPRRKMGFFLDYLKSLCRFDET